LVGFDLGLGFGANVSTVAVDFGRLEVGFGPGIGVELIGVGFGLSGTDCCPSTAFTGSAGHSCNALSLLSLLLAYTNKLQ